MGRYDNHSLRRTHDRRSPCGGFVVGILITGVGAVMLLNTLGIIDARNVWAYVPLIFVGLGISKIVEGRGSSGGMAFGGLLVIGGTIAFLDNIGVLWFDKRLFFPLIIIGVGIMFLVRAIERHRFAESGGVPATSDAVVHTFTILGGVKRFVDSVDFRGGDVFAMFGGAEVDLRPATIVDTAILDANAIFGGVDIRVPANWAVELKGVGILGGYEDKTTHPPAGEPAPRLVVTGFALFGGVTVQNV